MYNRSRSFPARAASVLALPGTLCLFTTPAAAYIGPGAGLSAIGTALALIAAVGLAVVGFLWYPAKRLSRRLFAKTGQTTTRTEDDHAEQSTSARPPA